jgi:hypothetical protein
MSLPHAITLVMYNLSYGRIFAAASLREARL